MDTITKRENCLEDSKLAEQAMICSCVCWPRDTKRNKASDGRLPATTTATTKMKNKKRPVYESARRAHVQDGRLKTAKITEIEKLQKKSTPLKLAGFEVTMREWKSTSSRVSRRGRGSGGQTSRFPYPPIPVPVLYLLAPASSHCLPFSIAK